MSEENSNCLDAKAVANRLKSECLSKLGWHCQMCQKQCRDDNGFKCHITSESHQRQLLLFAENPDKFRESFSTLFKEGYTEELRRKFGGRMVDANVVYQCYISNRDHIHMAWTHWETLTEFVTWLGKTGECLVDHSDKGLYVQLRKSELTPSSKSCFILEHKVSRCKEDKMFSDVRKQKGKAFTKESREYTVSNSKGDGEKLASRVSNSFVREQSPHLLETDTFSIQKCLSKSFIIKPSPCKRQPSIFCKFPEKAIKRPNDAKTKIGLKRKCALDEIIEFEENKRERLNRRDYWLHPGIIVQVITSKLGDKYLHQKAYVREVNNLYSALIEILVNGDILKVDQTHVQTVIPAPGKLVLIVNGGYRGELACLEAMDESTCSVRLRAGLLSGRLVTGVQYDDVCKLFLQDLALNSRSQSKCIPMM